MKLSAKFPTLATGDLSDPIKLGEVILAEIAKLPGKKIGFIGEHHSGVTTCMNYLEKSNAPILCVYDSRGIIDSYSHTLAKYDDLRTAVNADIPEISDMISSGDFSQLVDLIRLGESFRKLLTWWSVLSLIELYDQATNSKKPHTTIVFDLPYLPTAYNSYMHELVLVKRSPKWPNNAGVTEYAKDDGVTKARAKVIIAIMDDHIEYASNTGNWNFSDIVNNDGDYTSLYAKLDKLLASLLV